MGKKWNTSYNNLTQYDIQLGPLSQLEKDRQHIMSMHYVLSVSVYR